MYNYYGLIEDLIFRLLIIKALENEFSRAVKTHNIKLMSVLKVLTGIHALAGTSTNKPKEFQKDLVDKRIASLRTTLKLKKDIG